MTERTRVGLLGAGYICDAHANALTAIPNVTMSAVCDSARPRAAAAAAKYAIPSVLDSMEQLAASDCDVVHILLPPALHSDAAWAMVEAGKSVLLEKPMGLDSRACTALAARAAEKGVAVAVSHNFLFSPAYETLRSAVKAGELGRIDHIDVSWHFGLPILQFGPFDNWMLAAPANLLFEVGPHLTAFVIDLLGLPEIRTAVATNPIGLPGNQTVFRHWSATAQAGATTVALSISLTTGHADRMLRLRGRGGSAQLDFGRGIVWRETTGSDNPIFEAHGIADALASQARRQARQDLWRRLSAALAKRPDANPFEESLYRSIRAFYANGPKKLDARHDPHLGYQRHTAVRGRCRCGWRWNAESRKGAGVGRCFSR